MRKIPICSKKSVPTFKLRIEPYFLSHAERGKPFWILDSAGGMPFCRRFAPTPFRLQKLISISGGDDVPKLEPIRTLHFSRVDKIVRDLRRIYKENPSYFDVPTFAQKVY